jgi:hypothetical protein
VTDAPSLRRNALVSAHKSIHVNHLPALVAVKYTEFPVFRGSSHRWHEQIGDPSLADGIPDRLVHNAHRIEMRGFDA